MTHDYSAKAIFSVTDAKALAAPPAVSFRAAGAWTERPK